MKVVRARKAVFLDRDGTIARYVEYCRRVEEFELLTGVGEVIARLNRAGLLVVVVTNQSGITRRFLTPQTLEAIHEKMRDGLKRYGAWVDAIYVCPHHPDDDCRCRKPRNGMFLQAAKDLSVSLAGSYAVGDRLLDVQAGRAAGATTILVCSGHAPEPGTDVVPDYEAATLSEAVTWILRREAASMGG